MPPLVADAASRARQAGFPMSCDPAVGRLLAVLAAHLPARAKVAELGPHGMLVDDMIPMPDWPGSQQAR